AIPVPPEVDAAGIDDGGLLVAGLRPESFDDARRVDPAKQQTGQTFTAAVDLTEWLGNEQYAYVPYDSPHALGAQIAALAADLDPEALRPQLIVSLDPESRVAEGEPVRFWVDTSKMYLFDPRSGSTL